MQGQRSIIGSLPEAVDFDHVPNSTAVGGQQIFWNEIRSSEEGGLADFMHMNDGAMNQASIAQEPNVAGGWNLAESSSSVARNDLIQSGPKTDLPWPSSAGISVGNALRVEENRCEQANVHPFESVNMNLQYIHGNNLEALPQNFNLNAGFVEHGIDTFQNSAGSCGANLPRESDERPGCSLDGCRQSCKRKAIECGSSSSSLFQGESTSWPHVPGSYDGGSNLSMSVASQSSVPRLGLGLRGGSSDSSFNPPSEGSHRSFRLRINPSNQEPAASNLLRNSVASNPHQPPRLLAIDHYEFGPSVAPGSAINQSQSSIPPMLMQQNVQPLRTGSSLTPLALGDRDESSYRSARNLLDNPPVMLSGNELRSSARNLMGRNVSRNGASSSRAGANSGPHHLVTPAWVSPSHVSSRSSRRLAEYVRRSLFSSATEQADLRNPLQLRPSEESSASGNFVHRRSIPRSSWSDRQADSLLGIPYPLRTFAAANEGRSRHVSEQIRNMLDIMRRGEGLRFEDVMILDQSVFFGVADVHDRHRDMRLDVDNMSYEELLALEERIGNVSTGLSEETIVKLLKQRKYCDAMRAEAEEEPCCVCQEEYCNGDDLGSLDCGHNFHKDCIKQWLMQKNWCPICKTTGLATS